MGFKLLRAILVQTRNRNWFDLYWETFSERSCRRESDAGMVLAGRVERLMQAAGIPNGRALASPRPASAAKTFLRGRLLGNAPRRLGEPDLARLFRDALR